MQFNLNEKQSGVEFLKEKTSFKNRFAHAEANCVIYPTLLKISRKFVRFVL